jgi:squalene-hopene/tetraprenyl-beta-curcumene cyclase
MPTFCRGWGALPFDRSSADLTAHALLAWSAWREWAGADLARRIDAATARGVDYLIRVQRPDGAWAPLWFGNQHADEVANLTYGTSRVVRLAAALPSQPGQSAKWRERLGQGIVWLVSARNADGGWGGVRGTPSTIEETALAVEGLATAYASAGARGVEEAIASGVTWLTEHTSRGQHFPPAPIGFYFANLWYFEKLYPLIFTVSALSRVRESALRPSF